MYDSKQFFVLHCENKPAAAILGNNKGGKRNLEDYHTTPVIFREELRVQ